jgi:hypothetical protein
MEKWYILLSEAENTEIQVQKMLSSVHHKASQKA